MDMDNDDAYTTSMIDDARLVQLLKISGFSTTATMGHEDYVRSRWNVGDYEWEIRVYPTAHRLHPTDTTQVVAVQLAFLSESRVSHSGASLSCQLIDPRGRIQPSEERSVIRGFRDPQELSSEMQLIRRDDVVTSGYLEDDKLTLRCTFTLLDELPALAIPAKEVITPPCTNLHQQLGELLKSQTGVDVSFIVSGESVAAHKAILAARSPVFMAEFFGEMKEKCSRLLEVKDMDPQVFKAMLHFIYTDTVPELDEEVATMAQHLLVAADRYGLDRLKLICETKLSGCISVDTEATTLALAEQHNCLQLKAKCTEFIVSSSAVLDAVLATEGYEHLVASCSSVLTDLIKSACARKN